MRFSLRDVLVVVAFWAGIAWCAAQVGFDNGLFWSAVVASIVLCSLFIHLGRDKKRRHRALIATMPVLLLAFLMMSFTVLAETALLTVAVLYFARRPTPPTVRRLVGVCMGVTLIGLTCGLVPGLAMARTLSRMRTAYPVIPLEGRLQYEQREKRSNDVRDATLSLSLSKRLDMVEIDLANEYSLTADKFRRLHDTQYERFVRAAGFGIGRIIPAIMPREIYRSELLDVSFDGSDPSPEPDPFQHMLHLESQSNDLGYLHDSSVHCFIDPRYWGALIRPPKNVAGFTAHAFRSSPISSLRDPSSWSIERLELVSLLKFDGPRVYVLDHLPRMDQLSGENVPTRALDTFESKALAALYGREDVVVANEGRKYRMLGSLRAARQCLDCHGVQRGDLLGAFSYSLRKNKTRVEINR